MVDTAQKDLVDLFHKRRDLKIKAIILEQRLRQVQKEVEENNLLLQKSNIISEIYNDRPIKIVNLRRDTQQQELKEHFFVRVFPLFRRGKEGFYSANVYQRHDNRAFNVTLFNEELSGGIYLPFKYTRDSALELARNWITTHSVPERETNFIKECSNNETKPTADQRIETTNNETGKRKIEGNLRIYRPSQEPTPA